MKFINRGGLLTTARGYAHARAVVNFIDIFLDILVSKFWFSSGFWRFGVCRKVREACRKNFHLVAPLITSVVTSYDQKTKKVNEY